MGLWDEVSEKLAEERLIALEIRVTELEGLVSRGGTETVDVLDKIVVVLEKLMKRVGMEEE